MDHAEAGADGSLGFTHGSRHADVALCEAWGVHRRAHAPTQGRWVSSAPVAAMRPTGRSISRTDPSVHPTSESHERFGPLRRRDQGIGEG